MFNESISASEVLFYNVHLNLIPPKFLMPNNLQFGVIGRILAPVSIPIGFLPLMPKANASKLGVYFLGCLNLYLLPLPKPKSPKGKLKLNPTGTGFANLENALLELELELDDELLLLLELDKEQKELELLLELRLDRLLINELSEELELELDGL